MPRAAGLAAELDEPAVADYAVDDGRRHLVVAEDRAPPAELEVRRDHRRLGLVGVGEDLEDQPDAAIVDRAVHHDRLVEFGGPSHRLEESLTLGNPRS